MVRFTGFKPNSRRRTGDRVSQLKIVVTCRGLSEINKEMKCIQAKKNSCSEPTISKESDPLLYWK
jgi:hypothetical protein